MTRSTAAALALEAIFASALLGGAAFQHWARPGIESNFLALAPLLFPAHLQRLLVVLGRAPLAVGPALLVEAVATASVLVYPVPAWGVAVAVLAALAQATVRPSASEPRAWLRALAALGVLGGAACLAHEVALDRPLALLRALLFVPIVLEALAPGRERTDADALRRMSLGLLPIGTRLAPDTDLVYPALYAAALAIVHLVASRAPREERARRRVRTGIRLAAPAFVWLVIVLVGETGARLIPNPYRDTVALPKHAGHVPGGTYVYEGAFLGPKQPKPNVLRWNEGGWHDVDHARAKPAGTARILVLGDSYVEGVQVATDELYHRRIEALLGPRSAPTKVEAIALGNSGWGQAQELDALESQGLAYAPDVVIVEFLAGNDVRNNLPELEALANDDSYRGTPARVLFVRAINLGLFFHAFAFDKADRTLRRALGRVDPVDSDVYRAKAEASPPELWDRAWTRTGELVGALETSCRKAGAQLVISVFTSPQEIECRVPGAPPPLAGNYDFALPARRMSAICKEHGVPLVDLPAELAKLPKEKRETLHLAGDGHWAAPGHDEAARATASFLEESGLWARVLARVQKP